MSSEDVWFVASNLAALRDALTHQTDALSLLAAFDTDSLTNARQALRQVAADWAMPDSRSGPIGPPADEVGA